MDEHDDEQLDDLPPEAREALEDPEGPQARDLVDTGDGQTDTSPCPSCGRQIADLAERCPYCGDWVVRGQRGPASSRTLLFVAVVILLVIALLYWII